MRPCFSIKKRLILTALCFIATVVGLLFIACHFQILPQIKRLEKQAALQHIERLRVNLHNQLDALAIVSQDFVSYRFNTPHSGQIIDWQKAIPSSLLSLHGLSDVGIYTATGQRLAGQGFNGHLAGDQEINERLCREVLKLTVNNPKRTITGLMADPNGVMMVTARSVPGLSSRSVADSPIVIFCRPLSVQVVSQGSSLFQLDVAIHQLPLSARNYDGQQALEQLSEHQQVVLRQKSDQRFTSYARLVDVQQRPIGLLQLTLSRQPFMQIEHRVATTLGILLTILLLVMLLTTDHLRKIFLSPFHLLADQVHQLRQQHDNLSLPQSLGSEKLSEEINALLADLNQSRRHQTISEFEINLIKRVVPCAIFTVNQQQVISCWNDRAEQLTGYSAKEMVGSCYSSFIQNPNHDQPIRILSNPNCPVFGREFMIRHKNGSLLTISKNSEILYGSDGQPSGSIECFIDVTHHRCEKEARQWEVALNRRLSDLSKTMVEHCDNKIEIARKVLNHACNLTDSAHGFIAEVDQLGKQWLLDFTSLFNEFDNTDNLPFIPAPQSGRGSLFQAVYNRKTAIYFNELQQLNVANLVGGIDKPFTHFMAVPIRNGQQIVGQIAVANNDTGYTIRDLRAIEQLAELFAVILVKQQISHASSAHRLNRFTI